MDQNKIDIPDIDFLKCPNCIIQPICKQRNAEVELVEIYNELKVLLYKIEETFVQPFESPMAKFYKLLTKIRS